MMSTTPVASLPLSVGSLSLAPGTVLVEASAGTGKTYNIAELTVRALAEGFCTIDEVLLITFTTKATAELRSRVHRRLAECLQALDGSVEPGDVIHAAWQRSPAEARRRLQAAADDFDRATILTTHGFCQRALGELGILVDHDSTATAVEGAGDLAEEIAQDLYVDTFADIIRPPRPVEVSTLVGKALERPTLALVHDESPNGRGRAELARRARDAFEQRKRARQVYTFDDMVNRLHEALHDPASGPAIAAHLSERYRLVMVDEFQDTDVRQWEVIRAIFEGSSMLVLIGDPKQAIYGFRSADVHAYLMAAQDRQRHTLTRNHRSSTSVLKGVDALLNGAQLGEGIPTPPAQGTSTSLLDASGATLPATQVRVLESGRLDEVAEDLADHVVELLERGAVVVDGRDATPVGPGDIAVLTRSSYAGRVVARALSARGVPVVGGSGGGAPLASRAARDWRVLLGALVDLNARSIRRAALTHLVGWQLPDLVNADDAAVEALARDLRELSEVWRHQGFAALADAVMGRFRVAERLLGLQAGQDELEDSRQVSEAINRHEYQHHTSPELTLAWLESATPEEGGSGRLGTDEPAVRVSTIHGAKGLGFPIVLLPDLWSIPAPERKRCHSDPRVVHDADRQPQLDVSPFANRADDPEAADESLRLAYVAMTRARNGLRLWWVGDKFVGQSPLHRLLAHARPGERVPEGRLIPAERALAEVREALVSERCSAVDTVLVAPHESRGRVPGHAGPPGVRAGATPGPLEALVWTRRIDETWRRTSYTGLTHDLHEQAPVSLVVESGGSDEPELDTDDQAAAPVASRTPSPMAGIPGGTDFGTLVHLILEHVDPQSPDLRAAIEQAARPLLSGFGPGLDVDQLLDALVNVFDTPLGALTGGCLRDIPASDRLPELDFEMPMGGARPGTVGQLAALFSDRSLVPADDPLSGYGAVLADTPAAGQVLNGFLTGSIDAVLRVPGEGHERYVVVDYKTNTLPVAPGEQLCVEHYHADAMAQAMIQAHYPLQALLYCVALHRFLLWRLPGYDPARHLAGVGYLFVRGMAGPTTPTLGGMPAGVFTWHPSPELIRRADSILGGRQ